LQRELDSFVVWNLNIVDTDILNAQVKSAAIRSQRARLDVRESWKERRGFLRDLELLAVAQECDRTAVSSMASPWGAAAAQQRM